MINSTTNIILNHKTKAFMSNYLKPLAQMVAAVNIPILLSNILTHLHIDQNMISEAAVFVSKVGGALYVLFKIYDWISEKVKSKKEDNETK